MGKDFVTGLQAKLDYIEVLVKEQKFSEALAEVREQQTLKVSFSSELEKGRFLYLSALTLYHLGRYPEALTQAKEAYNIFRFSSENQSIGEVQHLLGSVYQAQGDFPKAETELRDAIAAYRRIEDHLGMANCFNKLANLYFVKSDYHQAIDYLKKALVATHSSGDLKTKSRILGNLGRIYTLMGEIAKAEENLKLNLEANLKFTDEINSSRAYLALGYVYLQKRELSLAFSHFEKAKHLIEKNNLPRELAIYHEYSGELAFLKGEFLEAEVHYQKVLDIAEKISPRGDLFNQGQRLLAELKLAQGEYTKALKAASSSFEVSLQLEDQLEQGAVYRIKSQIYDALREEDKAQKFFSKALETFKGIKNNFELGKTYLMAGELKSIDNFSRLKFLSKAEDLFGELKLNYFLGITYLKLATHLYQQQEEAKALLFLQEAEKIFKDNSYATDLKAALFLQDQIERKISQDHTKKAILKFGFENIITKNPLLKELLEIAKQFKDTDLSILLEGETGVGKDLLAQTIHYQGKRASHKFVAVNCAAIPETLLENQLFGYQKGAYTGADKDKPGLIELADGGTFYLDEIAEAPLAIQVKLLRVLETKEVYRLGDNEPRKVDVRFIASTNREISQSIAQGKFREDLYYRLAGLNLKLPPLRERKEDIPLLISHFLEEAGLDLAFLESKDIYQGFLEYDWPGNIRELENEIKKTLVLIDWKDDKVFNILQDKLRNLSKKNSKAVSLAEKVEEFEKSLITEALRATAGVKSRAARLLNIPESTLRHKVEAYHLEEE